MQDQLIRYIESRVKLSTADRELCQKFFEPVLYPRNRILEEQGKVPKYLYYIISGFLRLFHYNNEGDEVTTHLNCPPGFITPYRNFTARTRACESLETITDCALLRIAKEDLDHITGESVALKDFSIAMMQEAMAYNENRSLELATLSAENRYRNLMTTHPDILHNVPILYIASYLGMKPESLSRIRRKLIS